MAWTVRRGWARCKRCGMELAAITKRKGVLGSTVCLGCGHVVNAALAICEGCHCPFTYKYIGGRMKTRCPKCRKAYDEEQDKLYQQKRRRAMKAKKK